MKKLLTILLTTLLLLFYACDDFDLGLDFLCATIAECGSRGTAEYAEIFSRGFCYCDCAGEHCGEYCEFNKEDCEGDLIDNGNICRCKCPNLGKFKFEPPSCSTISLDFFLSPGKKTSTSSYFPLNRNDTWRYRTLDSMGMENGYFINFVATSYTLGDTIYKPVKISYPDSTGMGMDTIQGLMLFELKSDSNTIYQYSGGFTEVFLYNNFTVGDTIIDGLDTLYITDAGSVTVPAGNFSNCISVLGPDSTGFILAPDIGMVQFISEGQLTGELVEYELHCDFSLQLSLTNASCNATNDGQVLLSLAGQEQGTSNINDMNISWSGPVEPDDPVNPTNLAAGFYSITVTNGICETVIDSLPISAPEPIDIIISDIVSPSCSGSNDGSASINLMGGTGATSLNIDGQEILPGTIENLDVGTYLLTATDSLDCMTTAELVIEAQDPILAEATVSAISCAGSSDGSITTTVNGGNGPYSYSWSNGSMEEQIESLTAGDYSLTVTDANGCQAEFEYSLIEPDTLTATVAVLNVDCYGSDTGSIDLSVQGGTEPYSYIWDIGLTDEDVFALTAGSYTVTISDTNGCSLEYMVIVEEPQFIEVIETAMHPSCNGLDNGSVEVDVSGGTEPYGYVWDNGNNTERITNLPAGLYSLTITDANGCSEVLETELNDPIPLILQESVTDALCYGSDEGSITTMLQGGIPPYEFNWSTGDITSDIHDLNAGNYSVTVTDGNDCAISDEFVINQPDSIVLVLSSINATGSMSDGSAIVEPTGGTSPYSYLWDDPEMQTTAEAQALIAGVYTVTVTDDNGCEQVGIVEVTMSTSTSAPDMRQYINVYPNPAHEFIVIESNSNDPIDAVKLYALDGRIIDIPQRNEWDSVVIFTGHLEKGYYLLSTQHKGEVIRQMVLIL